MTLFKIKKVVFSNETSLTNKMDEKRIQIIKVPCYTVSFQMNRPFKMEHLSDKCRTAIIGYQLTTLPVIRFYFLTHWNRQ